MYPNTSAQLDHLFRHWQSRYPHDLDSFVSDGIIGSDTEWWSATKRVLFITKDSNDRNGCIGKANNDLRVLLRDSDRFDENLKRFEKNIGRWAFLLQRAAPGEIPTFECANYNHHDALLRSAVMNLKKIAGGGRADDKKVLDHALRDRDLILEQIRILNPEIIVFGRANGTVRLIKRIFADLNGHDFNSASWYRSGDLTWFAHWDPCKQGTSDATLYNELAGPFREGEQLT